MKAFGATVPGTKFRLLARGKGTSSGKGINIALISHDS